MGSENDHGEASRRTAFKESWVCKLKSQLVQAVKDEDYEGASEALELALQMAPEDELLKEVERLLEERKALHSESDGDGDSDSVSDSESVSEDEQEEGSPGHKEETQVTDEDSKRSKIADQTLVAINETGEYRSSETSEEEVEDHESDEFPTVGHVSFPKSVRADKKSFQMTAAERKELRGKLKEGIEDLKFRAMEAELQQKDPLLGLM